MKIKLCKSGSGSKPQNPLNKEKVTLEAKEAKLFCVLRSRKENNTSFVDELGKLMRKKRLRPLEN